MNGNGTRSLRRIAVLLGAATAALALTAGGLVAQSIPVVTSDNVSVVTTVPDVTAISGAFSQISEHYYLSTLGGIRVYDVSDPHDPSLTGAVPIAQFENEAMYAGSRSHADGTATEFVLVGNDLLAVEAPTGVARGYDPVDQVGSVGGSELLVVDVTDPADPYVRSRTQIGSGTHTVACIDPSCTTVYTSGSAEGFSIVDLTDLDAPVEVEGPTESGLHPSPAASGHYWDVDPTGTAWHTGRGGTAAFDVTDPHAPVLLNSTDPRGTEGPWNNFIHHNSQFPGAARFVETDDVADASWENGNILLVTEEDYENPTCDAATVSGGEGPGEGSFEIWYVPHLDAGRTAEENPDAETDGGTIEPVALYNTETLQGTVDNPLGGFCSAHWFNFHPTGIIAQGWYQEGMRLVDVRDPAAPAEYGHFYPGGSEVWDADWVPEYDEDGRATGRLSDVLYTNDLVRGIDVLEVDLPEEDLLPPAAVGPETIRLEGETRVETAVRASQDRFADGADVVVLARSDDYADALVGGPLAVVEGAPLLLTGPDGLHPAARAELERLGASTVILLGDLPAVASDLDEVDGVSVDAVGSADVFETSAAVADRIGGDAAYVAEGRNTDPARGWPDALAGSAAAASDGVPVVLVTRDALPEASRAALEGRTLATVLGGEVAVGEDVRDEIAATVDTVEEVAGATRYETAALLAAAQEGAGASAATTVLATGRDWPDALVAAPVVAAADGVLLLVDGQDPDGSPPASAFLGDRAGTVERLVLLGGTAAISQAVQVAAEAAIR